MELFYVFFGGELEILGYLLGCLEFFFFFGGGDMLEIWGIFAGDILGLVVFGADAFFFLCEETC